MNPSARRRAVAVDTVRPASPAPLQEQRSSNVVGGDGAGAVAAHPDSLPLPKPLTGKDYAAYAAERRQERERKRLEEAAQLRSKKMAAAARKSAGSGAGWSPVKTACAGDAPPARRTAGSSTARGAGDPAAPLATSSRNSSTWDGSKCAASGHPSTHHSSMARSAVPTSAEGSNGGWSPRKASPAPRAGAAPAPGPHAPATARTQGRPVPLLQLHKLSEQPQQMQRQQGGSKPGGPPSSRAAVASKPRHPAHLAAQPPQHQSASLSARLPTGRAAPAARGPATARGPEGRAALPASELGGSDADAQRAQQLLGWSALLVQAAAAVAAERVLLGPAARPDSQPPTAAELPLACGQPSPGDAAGRGDAAAQQADRALAALELQRRLKLDMARAAAPGSAEQQLLEAEAAADLQCQALVAHWALQAACEAAAQRQRDAEGCAVAQQS